MGYCHYGNNCKFVHEKPSDYHSGSDRNRDNYDKSNSHRNYHSSSDRNNTSNFKITIQNQSRHRSSSRNRSYSQSKQLSDSIMNERKDNYQQCNNNIQRH